MTEPRRAIEIIADEYVDPEFGSGCVKITAAHDFNDYEVYRRHPDKDIPLIVLFTPQAIMNENAPPRYRGLERFAARRRIVEDLRETKLLLREVPHRYKLPRGERSGAVVEPMLTDQWFIKLARWPIKALALTKDGKLRFVPSNGIEFMSSGWKISKIGVSPDKLFGGIKFPLGMMMTARFMSPAMR